MKSLPTPFRENGKFTAATASPFADCASGILLASSNACSKYNLRKRAKILSRVTIGCSIDYVLIGVVDATVQCLKKLNLKISDIDIFEINETFGTVNIFQKVLDVPFEKINPNGGGKQ